MTERIEVVLDLLSKVTGAQEIDKLSASVQKSVSDFAKLEAELNKFEQAQEKAVASQRAFQQAFDKGEISQQQYLSGSKALFDQLNSKAIPAFDAYRRAIDNANAALAKSAGPSTGEISGAKNFKIVDLPELQREIAGIDEFNAKLAQVDSNLQNFDIIKAKAFGRDETPQIKRDIVEIDEFNAKLSQVELNLENYDLIKAKAFRGTETPQIKKDLADIEQQANKTTVSLRQIGFVVAEFAAFYYLLRSIVSGLEAAVNKALEFQRASILMSQQLGISTQQAGGFVFQANALGIAVDTVTEAYRTFADRLARATGLFGEQTKGSRDMAKAMAELGISLVDADNNVRSMSEILPEVADKFQEMGPGIRTTAIATALFGQRADEMLPILLQGSEGIAKMTEEAQKLGLAMTDDASQAAVELKTSLGELNLSTQSISASLAALAGGPLKGFAILMSDVAFSIRQATVFDQALFASLMALPQGVAAAKQAFDDFIKSQGLQFAKNVTFGSNLTPKVLEPIPGQETFLPGTQNPPGEASDDASATSRQRLKDSLNDALKRREDAITQFNIDVEQKQRDTSIRLGQEEADFNTDRSRRFADHASKQLQARADFAREQLNRQAEFNRKQKQAEDDFAQDGVDRQKDHDLDIQRAIEDADIKRLQQAKQTADQRLKLEEQLNKDLQKLQDKWDEILLRLRVGGDIDSINQANAAAAAALQEQRDKNQKELDAFDDKKKEEAQIDEDSLRRKLDRMNEDFAISNERRERDFKEQRDRKNLEFQIEQGNRVREFEIDQIRENVQFLIKEERQRQDFLLSQQRIQENSDRDIADKAERFQRELNDLNNAVNEKAAAYFADANSLQTAENYKTDAARNGANTRIDIARMESDAMRQFRQGEYGSNDSGGNVPHSGGGPVVRAYAYGGIIPGALGSPQMFLGHGGERIVPPATSTYYSNVRQGNQVTIDARQSFTANMQRGDPGLIAQQASREIGRTIAALRSYS